MSEPIQEQSTLEANDVATLWPDRTARKEAAVETPPTEEADQEEVVEETVMDEEPEQPAAEWKPDERDEQIRILSTQLTAMATQLKQMQEAQKTPVLPVQQKQYLDASKLDLTEALDDPTAFANAVNSAILQAVTDATELARQGIRTEMPGFVRAQIEQHRVAQQREAQFYEKNKDIFTNVPAPVATQRKTLATQIMNGLYSQNAAYYDTLGEKAWDMLAIDTSKALREALNAPPTMQAHNSRSTEKRADSTKMFPPAGQRANHKDAKPTNTKQDEIESTLTKGRKYHAPINAR